ncbi:hypothetical protein Hanom_Chr09g00811481 [Helianthus anomalus]
MIYQNTMENIANYLFISRNAIKKSFLGLWMSQHLFLLRLPSATINFYADIYLSMNMNIQEHEIDMNFCI